MSFKNILIANRGEIAVRIIGACRALGITTTAVYSEADRGALHVRQADHAALIGPAPAAESYLNVERIVEAALRYGCDALHPGYGFLSERAVLARACAEAGITFIGPNADTIDLMGSKIAAKRLAEQSGVPTVPGYLGDDQNPDALRARACDIGFPVLIKASAGGGGRGMRVVRADSDFAAALEGAQREALAAFGDGTVMLERLIERPRHIEIQVLADHYGHTVHLFERECSIQRRHQKIVEEAPSPALNAELRAYIGAAAVRLAQAAAYVNAGTVEFVLDEQGRFFFLEMNTRLQVEHPVTEQTTGHDLVQLQIAIAAGEPLPFAQADLQQRGHAIEMRIYAEDPATMLPSTGAVLVFEPPQGAGIRNDAGLAAGDAVSMYYDPMIAKLIVSAGDRASAVALLGQALDAYAVLGVDTNIPLLRAIAAHPAFAQGATTTDFLETTGLLVAPAANTTPDEVLAAIALAEMAQPVHASDPWEMGAWRGFGERVARLLADDADALVRVAPVGEFQHITIEHRSLRARMFAEQPPAYTIEWLYDDAHPQPERIWIIRDGATWLVNRHGVQYRVEPGRGLHSDDFAHGNRRSAGHASLAAPMPGTIVRVLVEEGQQVEAHQPLVVLEAMKMEHVVAAPHTGIVRHIAHPVGSMVQKGAALVDVDSE